MKAGASPCTAATSDWAAAPPAAAPHDKLQAVLAQARAIRSQPKAQIANRPHLSSIQPGQSTRSVTSSQITQLNTTASKHDRVTKPCLATDITDGSVSSRHRHAARPSSKSQLPSAQQAEQQLPEQLLQGKLSASGKGTAKKVQSDTSNKAVRRPVPLQLPASFTEALNVLR